MKTQKISVLLLSLLLCITLIPFTASAETIIPQPLTPSPDISIVFNAETGSFIITGIDMIYDLPHNIELAHGGQTYLVDTITPTSGSFSVTTDPTIMALLWPTLTSDMVFDVSVHVVQIPPGSWIYTAFSWYFSDPTILSTALPNGTVGVAYTTYQLDATSDELSTPKTWSIVDGALPLGLSLSDSGVVSGTPTQVGTFAFTVKFGNSAAFDTKEFTITILPAPPAPPAATQYTVTITNGGAGHAVTGGPNHTAGSNVTINAGTRAGFVFDGWTFSPSVTLATGHNAATTSTTFVMPTQNVVATANWVAAPPQDGGGVGSGNWGGGAAQRPPATQPPSTAQTSPPTDQEPELHLLFMIGDDMGNFRPQASITRAEAATVLARVNLLDFETGIDFLPEGMSAFNTFADVNDSDWFYHYVAWAYSDGLIRGDSPDGGARYFRPNDPITRQEFSAILARTAESLTTGDTPFADADNVADWAQDYVFTTYTLGHMIGDEANHFRPATNVSRAEVATAISRLLGRIADRANFYSADVVNVHQAISFPDVSDTAWYFPSTLSATNDQYLTRTNGVVDWKEFVTTIQ